MIVQKKNVYVQFWFVYLLSMCTIKLKWNVAFSYYNIKICHLPKQNLDRGTVTDKIGNIHRLWFSSITVKTLDVTT